MQFVKKVVESRFDYGICKSKKLWLSFFFLACYCFALHEKCILVNAKSLNGLYATATMTTRPKLLKT